MQLNDHGLPLPGRELDEAIAKLLGYEVVEYHADATRFPYVRSNSVSDSRLCTESGSTSWQVSTTHAFFQVMEAMSMKGYEWRFTDNLSWLLAEMDRSYGVASQQVELPIADYPDREHAYAHAVCCCAWKAYQ